MEVNSSVLSERRDISLTNSIRQKLKTVSSLSSMRCIHRVPKKLRSLNDAAYTPQVISIGPFHRAKESLQVMEEHKWRYLNAFLVRYPQTNLKDCVKGLRDLEKSARQSYSEAINLSSDEFVEMMLLDGFFILALFLKTRFKKGEITMSDPIFDMTWMFVSIKFDLILLENQIPFSVLDCLFCIRSTVQNQADDCPSLLELTRSYFQNFWKIDEIPGTISNSDVKHLLDFVRICHLPSSTKKSQQSGRKCNFIRSAIELHEAGVKFKVGESNCLLDISFENGVLEIPFLQIVDWTESLFRNLIALEQCDQKLLNPGITSYVALMDSLINTPRDVGLLIHYGIIESMLGDNEGVSHLFNNLFKEVTLEPSKFYFFSLCEDLNAHCKMRRHKWMASLKRDYFNTPWAIISFSAAAVLLILTFIQTVCALISKS